MAIIHGIRPHDPDPPRPNPPLSRAAPPATSGAEVHLDSDGNPRIVERRFVVEDVYAGYRLDHYLKRMIPRLSRTKVQRIIRTQLLPVRGRTLKPHSTVCPGDEIVIRRPARPEPDCPRTFTVLHDDADMMVIDKPAGLPVHASAKFYFNTLTRVVAERYPGQGLQICHRLDRETSGVLVLARGKAAASFLESAFAHRRVRKVYLALVHGQPSWPHREETGDLDTTVAGALAEALGDLPRQGSHLAGYHLIDEPLGIVPEESRQIAVRMMVRPDAPHARTFVRVLAQRSHAALIVCIPVTGRQHQIRAHLAVRGHAIVGDKLYGHGDEAFRAYCAQGMTDELLARFELPRHALHAAAIAVPAPGRPGELVRVISRLPADLRAYLDRPDHDSNLASPSPSPLAP